MGPWREYPPLSEYTEVDWPNYEGFRALRFVQANVGDVEIQLVEPSPDHDTPQKRFLEEHGEGVYHIGFVVDDVNEGEKVLKKKGVKTTSRGRRPDQSDFNYLDTKDGAGVVLLIRKSTPAHSSGGKGPAD
jgi:4-hydroxyphenylpyruvate dioxygenase-like putative hemolysin